MSLFNNFPWTNFHELNLDWLLKKVAAMEQAFPEGTVGISKGGTGATTAEDARANLGVYGINIPMNPVDPTTIDDAIQGVAGDLDTLITSLNAGLKYKLFSSVSDIGQTPGTATILTCWIAMSAGEALICAPDQLYPGECPETYGTLILIRSGATSGYCLFAGEDHLYRKTYSSNAPQAGWEQVYTDGDIVPITNGGTGADNATDALANLGIDFSGTVLSVAGVGADPTGDVPLTLLDIVYTDVTDLGLVSGSAVSAVWSTMAAGSVAVIPESEIATPPGTGKGIVIIVKEDNADSTGMIKCFDRNSGKEWNMGFSAGSPSGTWDAVVKESMLQIHNVGFTSTTFNAGGAKSITATPTWNGKAPLAIVGVRTGNTSLSVFQFYINGTRDTVTVGIRNNSSSAITPEDDDIYAVCLYVI